MQKDTQTLIDGITAMLFVPTSLLGILMFMYGGIIAVQNANDPWQSAYTGANVLWFGMSAAVCGAAWCMLDSPKNKEKEE